MAKWIIYPSAECEQIKQLAPLRQEGSDYHCFTCIRFLAGLNLKCLFDRYLSWYRFHRELEILVDIGISPIEMHLVSIMKWGIGLAMLTQCPFCLGNLSMCSDSVGLIVSVGNHSSREGIHSNEAIHVFQLSLTQKNSLNVWLVFNFVVNLLGNTYPSGLR